MVDKQVRLVDWENGNYRRILLMDEIFTGFLNLGMSHKIVYTWLDAAPVDLLVYVS